MNTIRLAPVSLFPLIGAMLLLVLGAGSGCQSDFKTRTYAVTVANDSSEPVTVWLTKNGPAYEPGWLSPEDSAFESRGAGESVAGVVVPPGKTASVGPVNGEFASMTTAMLRVYLGQHNLSELLAISKGSPDRKDFELDPGRNDFTIVDQNGQVLVQRNNSNNTSSAPMNMSNEPAADSSEKH